MFRTLTLQLMLIKRRFSKGLACRGASQVLTSFSSLAGTEYPQTKITRGVHLPYLLWYHQFGSKAIFSYLVLVVVVVVLLLSCCY